MAVGDSLLHGSAAVLSPAAAAQSHVCRANNMGTTDANSSKGVWRALDMTAQLEFSSASSKSFTLERYSKSLCPTRQLGWIEIHHPCEGHIKAQIRASLPEEYQQPEKMREVVEHLLAHAGIPAGETYEAHFISPSGQVVIARPVDRNGYTDRI